VQISIIALFESVQPATKTPRHREPVTDVTGVAIPIKFADSALKAMEIAPQAFPSVPRQCPHCLAMTLSFLLRPTARQTAICHTTNLRKKAAASSMRQLFGLNYCSA